MISFRFFSKTDINIKREKERKRKREQVSRSIRYSNILNKVV